MTVADSEVPDDQRLLMPRPEGLQPETQEVWRLHMDGARHLAQRDYGHVLAWVHAWDDYFVVRKELLAGGRRTQSQKYGVTMHPLVRMMALHRAEILRLEVALGFNPQARLRLGLTFAAAESALDRLRGRVPRRPPAKIANIIEGPAS